MLSVVQKHGLEQEYNETLRRMEKIMKVAFAPRVAKPGA